MDDRPEAEGLVRWLEDVGFTLTEAHEPNMFDNVAFVLMRDDVGVSIQRDRGHWSIDLWSAAVDTWKQIGVWIACVDDEQASVEGLLLTDLGRLLKARLDEIERIAARAGLLECLEFRQSELSGVLMAEIFARRPPKGPRSGQKK